VAEELSSFSNLIFRRNTIGFSTILVEWIGFGSLLLKFFISPTLAILLLVVLNRRKQRSLQTVTLPTAEGMNALPTVMPLRKAFSVVLTGYASLVWRNNCPTYHCHPAASSQSLVSVGPQ